jgi:hypothetical protein
VTRVDASGKQTVLAEKLPCPPCNVGLLSIPDYGALAGAAVHDLASGETVFAGQRADAFFVDPGAIFDLGTPRAARDAHLAVRDVVTFAGQAVDATDRLNVHSIAIQLPLTAVRRDGSTEVRGGDPGAVIGVWTSASRRPVQVRPGHTTGDDVYVGPHTQVSRLGNPLVNQVIVPMAERDRWNTLPPGEDKRFAEFVEQPELAALLPVLYPGRFDHLAALNETGGPRTDLLAVLLTGIPDGLIENFQNTTGDGRRTCCG